MGYHRAGFEVVGVDINPQPRYPFEFHQADALEFPLDGFDVIHASPPCQSYSRALRHLAAPQPMLIEEVRDRISVAPYVIENVPGAPLPGAIMLCGTSFGLRVYRHRLFETSVALLAPPCDHSRPAFNPHHAEGRERIYAEYGRGDPERRWRNAMQVPWMNRHETREAIPPAYTEYIGRQLLRGLS